jgi:hypothetical protein
MNTWLVRFDCAGKRVSWRVEANTRDEALQETFTRFGETVKIESAQIEQTLQPNKAMMR